jgi:hypothetical protein
MIIEKIVNIPKRMTRFSIVYPILSNRVRDASYGAVIVPRLPFEERVYPRSEAEGIFFLIIPPCGGWLLSRGLFTLG